MTGLPMPSISLLTFNCFGSPAPGTRRRLVTLADEINRRAYDVVMLQEVQANAYLWLLKHHADRYPLCAFQPFLHAPKGGLLTLAQDSVDEITFILYQERRLWYTPALADWILHKGILKTAMIVDGVPVVMLNTHLTANYSGDWRLSNLFAREERDQLAQLAALVCEQPPDALVIAAGDFNIPRGSGLYDTFLAESGMIDPLANDMRPTLRTLPGMPARYAQPIDFTFIRFPQGKRQPNVESNLVFTAKIEMQGGQYAYLSDHCGVELTIHFNDEP